MFAGRRIVLGVTGGIAAYKAVEVCRRLVDAGAHVAPIMTKGASHFIGETTLSALASEPVQTSLWDEASPIPHTRLGQESDLIIVAPATARLLSDYANEFKNIDAGGMARLVVERAADTVLYGTPVARALQTITDQGQRRRAVGHLRGEDAQRALLADRVATLAGPDDWLFPSPRAGQPISPKTLGERLLRHGVGRAARVAALHHLIEHVPAPVLADLIGYNPNFIADRAASLATNWASYPAIRHRTRPVGT